MCHNSPQYAGAVREKKKQFCGNNGLVISVRTSNSTLSVTQPGGVNINIAPVNVDELRASHLCTEEAQARTDEFAEVFDNTLRMCYYFKAKLLLVHLKQSQAYCLVFIHYRFH